VLKLAGLQLDGVSQVVVGWLPLAAAILLALWDLVLWRLPLIQDLTHRPRIDGLWTVTVQPTKDSLIPDGGNRGPISGYVVISQTFWSVYVRQLTAESKSSSRAFFWEDRGDADVEPLRFLFENEPDLQLENRSRRHRGSCAFNPASLTPQQMSGVYFTDRYTKGTMALRLIDRTKGYDSFAEAASHEAGLSPQ
jgi:hypothetical protein